VLFCRSRYLFFVCLWWNRISEVSLNFIFIPRWKCPPEFFISYGSYSIVHSSIYLCSICVKFTAGKVIWEGVHRSLFPVPTITHQFTPLVLHGGCACKNFLWQSNGNMGQQTSANYEVLLLFLFSATANSRNVTMNFIIRNGAK
jgi:hypothetical protein